MKGATRRKLIEVALPLPEINDASAYDKMPGIGPHPKGIHQWWARLPLPVARAVLFASLVDDPAEHPERWSTEESQRAERERLFALIRRMMGPRLHERLDVYAEGRDEILRHCGGRLPIAFDPFAGGGSIPLEATRLGLEARARDLNPIAVLLNKCNLELAPRWVGHPPVNPDDGRRIGGMGGWQGTDGLAADVRHYGRVVRDRARGEIGNLFPRVAVPREMGGGEVDVVAYIWARTVASPNPAAGGRHVPLASTFMLSTKPGKMAWLEPTLNESTRDGWTVVVRTGELSKSELARVSLGTKSGKAQAFVCLLTGVPIQRAYVQAEGKAGRLSRRLLAIVANAPGGRLFLPPASTHESTRRPLDARVEEARQTLLSGPLPTRAEITGGVCTAYGLTSWGHLFSERQITALLTLSDLVQAIEAEVRQHAMAARVPPEEAACYARTVTTFLALALDRCADFNNVLCRWSPSNQKVMNLFGRQALPMVFDSAEANVLGESVGAWSTCSDYVAACVRVLSPGSGQLGDARQADAASGAEGPQGLLVSTDPPYYGNISYATLSDFFYVWLRRTIGASYPDLFGTVLTPKLPELIASPDRFGGSKELAKEHFESGFRKAFTDLRDRLDSRFPLTVYYAFKQDDEERDSGTRNEASAGVDLTTGWETLLEAIIASGFQITATWPVRASQKWRMVSMGTNALASYIVLACRVRATDAPETDRRSLVADLKREMPSALRRLQQGNIAPVDFAQAAIGPGMALYSRYSRVLDSTGRAMGVRAALSLINQLLTEVLSEQDDDFDADTRWAVAWFEQHGFDLGDYGEAELLSKAKVTSVAGLKQAGLVVSKSGGVRLVGPEDLPQGWDPETDGRITVWEMTHHLLRVYFHERAGDVATGDLLRRIGAQGDSARDLAYRLFSVCERKGLSQEALAYNALVLGWPEIARLSRERAPQPPQADLFGRR